MDRLDNRLASKAYKYQNLDHNSATPIYPVNRKKHAWFKVQPGAIKVLFCIAVLVASFLSFVVAYMVFSRSKGELCETPACVLTSSKFLATVDTSTKVCDSVYDFACGNDVYARSDKIKSSFWTAYDTLLSRVKDVMDEPERENEFHFVKMVKKFYQSCMKVSDKEILSLIERLGGWPILQGDTWNKTLFNWMESDYIFKKEGYINDYFIRLDFDLEEKTIELQKPRCTFCDEELEMTNNEYMNKEASLVLDFVLMQGVGRARAEKELLEVIEFRRQLFTIPSSNLTTMTIDEMDKLYHQIVSWSTYIKLLMPPGSVIEGTTTVRIDKSYFDGFLQLMEKTPRRVQANYAIFAEILNIRAIIHYMAQQDDEFPKWTKCVNKAYETYPEAMSYLNLHEGLDENEFGNYSEIVDYIKQGVSEMLSTTKWSLDASCQQEMMGVLDEISLNFTWAIKNLKEKAEVRASQDIVITDDYILNRHRLYNYFMDHQIKLQTFFDPEGVPNPEHAITLHFIQIMTAFSIRAYYDGEDPKYMNYGGIGHEIAGLIFKNVLKPKGESELGAECLKFLKHAERLRNRCLIGQFNTSLMEVGTQLHGHFRLDNKVVDNGGVKAAYIAYNKWLSDHAPEPTVVGMPLTNKQMFWISLTQRYCKRPVTDRKKGGLRSQLIIPYEEQVNLMLANIPEFSEDFQCRIGDPMNPKKKCHTW